MRKIIFLGVVIVELAVIAFLAGKIYLKSQDQEENVSINPISKEDVIFPNPDSESDLKNFYEPMPNTEITYKPSWLPPDYTYTSIINADSLNERFDYSFDKQQDVFRIIALGESYTFGWSVDTKENYPEKLEDLLNRELKCQSIRKFEVINLGVGGYDIEYSVHRFKVRGKKYNPDLILWFVRNGDFTVINELIKPKMDQYMKDMNSNHALLTQLQKEGNFYPWSTKAAEDLKTKLGEEGVFAYSKKALWRMNDYYKGRLVFITISSGKGSLTDPHLSMLQSFAKERGNTYIYDGLSNNYDHFVDRHPTGKGYAQIAGQIFDYLKQNGFVPCDSL